MSSFPFSPSPRLHLYPIYRVRLIPHPCLVRHPDRPFWMPPWPLPTYSAILTPMTNPHPSTPALPAFFPVNTAHASTSSITGIVPIGCHNDSNVSGKDGSPLHFKHIQTITGRHISTSSALQFPQLWQSRSTSCLPLLNHQNRALRMPTIFCPSYLLTSLPPNLHNLHNDLSTLHPRGVWRTSIERIGKGNGDFGFIISLRWCAGDTKDKAHTRASGNGPELRVKFGEFHVSIHTPIRGVTGRFLGWPTIWSSILEPLYLLRTEIGINLSHPTQLSSRASEKIEALDWVLVPLFPWSDQVSTTYQSPSGWSWLGESPRWWRPRDVPGWNQLSVSHWAFASYTMRRSLIDPLSHYSMIMQ